MNPLPFILLAISLPLLLGGCGGKDESTTETNTVEGKVQEVKEEVKPEEPLAETNPELEGVNEDELEYRGVYPLIAHLKGSDTPYSGKWFILYENGNKKLYGNFKDGKEDGLQTSWYINGQKSAEVNFKDGKGNGLLIWWHPNGQKKFERMEKNGSPVEGSIKFWNSKGEPVADLLEAEGIR